MHAWFETMIPDNSRGSAIVLLIVSLRPPCLYSLSVIHIPLKACFLVSIKSTLHYIQFISIQRQEVFQLRQMEVNLEILKHVGQERQQLCRFS